MDGNQERPFMLEVSHTEFQRNELKSTSLIITLEAQVNHREVIKWNQTF